ncbi:ATP-binding protein [Dolichospermum compactum]|uniref:Integral membrane sensor signal transduction histidine kinase n=1 Tax=Dolichospermum compactum NIES-806 TaxID=1973481 RepID=A0A1Z4V6C9_9CYAN|nr:ATP-binding protein [Dolichospermum compactum]BAZ86994.1 integral membrane sensor signal transduction histidine kinase [Dolichospermum compactum NIES-806]
MIAKFKQILRTHLFEYLIRFFTTTPVGKGTGLGLSISYQIVVEEHKGKIRCFSHPETGTKLQIEIPTQVNP